jgi:hypothetical protein
MISEIKAKVGLNNKNKNKIKIKLKLIVEIKDPELAVLGEHIMGL